ncbi:signal peptidase I [Periweissella beninensis]|uniref:signal peptidase I n=1 Tax=Periweissella beninensis TaxID=504936 RepID=UPI0021A95C27|nr:signal peptidase I [Periweissella beninensis]MCT4396359.1 signal peptidase I [Periweissella beninensis]
MKTFKSIMGWIIPIVLGLAIALLIKQFLVSQVKVDGTSMQPNLQNTERVWIVKPATIHRGSVIVFDAKGEDPTATVSKDYVKRVIGLPGDTVSNENGVLKVNGKVVNQSFISKSQRTSGTQNWSSLRALGTSQNWQRTVSIKVPKGQYFVLGDHRSVSNDSRYWGFVNKSKVLGVVKVTFWHSNPAKDNINKQWQHFFK